MKNYIKPSIVEEKIELEDIIAVSNGGDISADDAGFGNLSDIVG